MENFDYSAFRANLRRLIEVRGFTVKGFAAEVEITAATLSRYLSGDRTPDLPYVVRLAQYFNVSIDWLLGLNGEMFDVMPKELQTVAKLYSVATLDDRNVVQAVLSKYKEE